MSVITHEKYRIRRTPAALLPFQLHPRANFASHIIAWTLWLLYIYLALRFIYQAQIASKRWLWHAYVAISCEIALTLTELAVAVSAVTTMFLVHRSSRPRYELLGDEVPTVDVLLPCCGEPLDIILDTLDGIVKQDYPPGKFHVYVLDDAKNQAFAEAARLLDLRVASEGGPKIHYLARDVKAGQKSYFKAGNLQFGIEQSNIQHGGEFLASLDTDMIPERDWLRKMVPHLILDAKLGLACPPQRYYNLPESDPFGQQTDFDLYFTLYEPLNDFIDAAMCTGSGFVVRRAALDNIGGWPLIESGEDYFCSMLLTNMGWRVAFVQEYLQLGLAPDNIRAHIGQRMRWTDNGIAVYRHFGSYGLWDSDKTPDMTLPHRIVAICMAIRDYAPIANVLALVFLPSVLYSGTNEWNGISTSPNHYMLWIVFVLSYIARKVYSHVVFGHIGVRRIRTWQSMDIWCSPYLALRGCVSLLPAKFNNFVFEASGVANASSLHERSALRRKSLSKRILILPVFIPAIYVLVATAVMMLLIKPFLAILGAWTTLHISLFPFPGVILKLLDVIYKAAVPVWYMIDPPTVPERKELFEADGSQPKRMNLQEDVHDGIEAQNAAPKTVEDHR